MSWENHGEWHVDHIVPLASAKTEAEVAALFALTNLRPLWASENQRKRHLPLSVHLQRERQRVSALGLVATVGN
jgi:hypothetical protein